MCVTLQIDFAPGSTKSGSDQISTTTLQNSQKVGSGTRHALGALRFFMRHVTLQGSAVEIRSKVTGVILSGYPGLTLMMMKRDSVEFDIGDVQHRRMPSKEP